MHDLSTTTGCSLQDAKAAVAKRIKETGFEYSDYRKVNIAECDLCKGMKFKLYSHQDRYTLPVRSMQCENCGLIFITPRMTLSGYKEFYDNWYRTLVNAFNGREENKMLDLVRKDQADFLIEFLKKHLPPKFPNQSLLDVGGSTGTFARAAKDTFGFEVATVIDPCKDEAKEAADKGLTTQIGNFEQTPIAKKYSFIAMLKTIEHLQSIKHSLEKIKNALEPNGFVFLDCIDHEWLVQFTGKQLATKLDHVYQLTSKTVERYIEKAGFEIYAKEQHQRYLLYLLKVEDIEHNT